MRKIYYILITLVALSLGTQLNSQDHPRKLQYDPTYYLLGMLDVDYRSRYLPSRNDYLDSFRQEYTPELFQFYVREMMRTIVPEAELIIEYRRDGRVTFYSQELSDYLNSFFNVTADDFDLKHAEQYNPCVLDYATFEQDEHKMISYLAGVYARYNKSYGYWIRWNSPKAKLVLELLESLDCQDIQVEYPDTTGVGCGAPELKIKFNCIPEIWKQIRDYDIDVRG